MAIVFARTSIFERGQVGYAEIGAFERLKVTISNVASVYIAG